MTESECKAHSSKHAFPNFAFFYFSCLNYANSKFFAVILSEDASGNKPAFFLLLHAATPGLPDILGTTYQNGKKYTK
jgi:hypothetical protein